MTVTVLITSAGGGLSSQAIRNLQQSGRHSISVVAVDARADAAGRHFADVFAQVPGGGDPGYVDAIATLVAKYKVDLILPCSDEEALALAGRRQAVEVGNCKLACASFESLRTFSDKHQCYSFLRDNGIPVPRWRHAETPEAFKRAVAEFAALGEFAIKPARSRGNRDIYVIRRDLKGVETTPSGRELHMDVDTFRRDHMAKLGLRLPFLVMERLVPPAYDIDVLSWLGDPVRVVPRRRLNVEGVPFHGNVVVNGTALIDLGRRVASAAKLSWLYDVDVMTSQQGQPVVLEVNPRPSGSLVASLAAGIPLLDDLVSLLKGEPVPPCTIPDGRLVVPYTAVAAIGAQHQRWK